jgi:hypothetical protein
MAHSLGVSAFALGRDIYFRKGKYNPETEERKVYIIGGNICTPFKACG